MLSKGNDTTKILKIDGWILQISLWSFGSYKERRFYKKAP